MMTEMKLTIVALIFAFLSTTAHADFTYPCKVNGKTYLLRVDEDKNVLEWRGKKYTITNQPNCAKYGWHAEGNGTSFDVCTMTQGYAAIEAKNGNAAIQCDQYLGRPHQP
jgi:hypothetical protein